MINKYDIFIVLLFFFPFIIIFLYIINCFKNKFCAWFTWGAEMGECKLLEKIEMEEL